MICPACGAHLDDDSKFCEVCGSQIGLSDLTPATESEKSTPGIGETAVSQGKPLDRRIKIIGLSVGTVIMIIGFIRIASSGTSVSSTSFGGDFYTYTYQGIVAVAEALAAIEVTLGWILVAIGAAIDILSLQS